MGKVLFVARECDDCEGCGKVANTEEREPWSEWANLPIRSALAVISGVVAPILCTQCMGEGFTKEKE